MQGSLAVVGCGIQFAGQATPDAIECVRSADKVLYLTFDAVTEAWLHGLNPSAESLHGYYEPGVHRLLIYQAMSNRIMALVREGLNVCVVTYGHPGFWVEPAHEAIQLAKAEGYPATMHPGVSSVDCLFADLGVDAGEFGCQIQDATAFLIFKRPVDVTTPLILMQIGMSGRLDHQIASDPKGLAELAEVLTRHYGASHCVTVYSAATYPFTRPSIQVTSPSDLPQAHITLSSTLYVPPLRPPALNVEVLTRLAMDRTASGEPIRMPSGAARAASEGSV